jgi:hypothetical protein
LFDDDAAVLGLDEPEVGFFDPATGAVCFKFLAVNNAKWDEYAPQLFVDQYVNQYFGGPPPLWIAWGLKQYGVLGHEAAGKPDKPLDKQVAAARRYMERSPTLDKLFRVHPAFLDKAFGSFGDPKEDQRAAHYMLWGWHSFFRHAKQGKKYRKAYESCLKTLQATGRRTRSSRRSGRGRLAYRRRRTRSISRSASRARSTSRRSRS